MRKNLSFVRTGGTRTRMFLLLFGLLICNTGWATTYNIEYRFGNLHPTNPNPATYEYNPGTTITLLDPEPISEATFDHWEIMAWWQTWSLLTITEIDCGWDPSEVNFDKIIIQAVYRDYVEYNITYNLPAGVANDSRNPTTYTLESEPRLYPIPDTEITDLGVYRHLVGTQNNTYPWRFKNAATGEYIGLANWYSYLPISRLHLSGDIIAEPQLSLQCVVDIRCEKGIVVTLMGLNIQVTEDNPYHGYSSTSNQYLIRKDFDDWNDNYKFDGVEVTPAGAVDEDYYRLTINGNTSLTFKSTNAESSISYRYLPTIFSYTPDAVNPTDSTDLRWWWDPERPATYLTRTFKLAYNESQTLTIPTNLEWEWQGNITFDGWYHDSLFTDPASSTVTIPANTCYRANTHRELYNLSAAGESTFPANIQRMITYYAKWISPIEYHDEGGGAYSGSNLASLPVNDYWMPHITLPDGEKAGFAFLGWYDNSDCTGDPITKAPGNYGYRNAPHTHPIVYAKWQPLLELRDKEPDSYYNDILTNILPTYGDNDISVKLVDRTFYAGMWNTLCLPFDLSEEQLAASPLKDAKIYTFSDARGNPQEYLDLEVEEVNEITARHPYLIYFKGQNIVSPIFNGVRLADNAFTNDETGVGNYVMKLYGTVHYTDFPANNQNYLFVGTGNNLYYSNVPGHQMPAFRAYFHGSVIQSVRPRARIVVKEQTSETPETPTGLSEQEEQSGNTERKYMENGVLYIERNGVIYNAQGVRVK